MVETATVSKSLLIVEDNDVEREGLATLLRLNGYSIRAAADGCQADELLRADKPDLILLDMLLGRPGDDGWKLLDKIRRNLQWRAIPVIIVTGMSVACHEWAVALGAQTVILKPIDTDDLFHKLEQFCR